MTPGLPNQEDNQLRDVLCAEVGRTIENIERKKHETLCLSGGLEIREILKIWEISVQWVYLKPRIIWKYPLSIARTTKLVCGLLNRSL